MRDDVLAWIDGREIHFVVAVSGAVQVLVILQGLLIVQMLICLGTLIYLVAYSHGQADGFGAGVDACSRWELEAYLHTINTALEQRPFAGDPEEARILSELEFEGIRAQALLDKIR